MSPKVSVVMASYNHAEFVRESIESVLHQSFTDFELVITDDGSSDGTVDVVRSVADPRIDFVALAENQGACDALNSSIRRSQGQYVAVLNSDDFFLPGKLGHQVDYLDTHLNIGAVFGQPKVVDETGRELADTSHPFATVFSKRNRSRAEWLRYFFEIGNGLCHPTLMIRRSCYDKAGLYDPILRNLPDLDMWFRVCQCFDIHVMSEQLTAFRVLKNERNTSAPSAPNMARIAWETPYVLGHLARLPEAELRDIIEPWPEAKAGRAAHAALALAALRVDKPGYRPFALALLRDLIVRDREAFSLEEYFRLVGENDPNGMKYATAPVRSFHLKGFSLAHGLLDEAEAWWRRRL